MAPGDLNLKKSWNPALMKNQQKVWEAEKAALEERKKIHERQREIKKERELIELRQLQGTVESKRLDWMYDTPKQVTHALKSNEDDLRGNIKTDTDMLRVRNKSNKLRGFEGVLSSGASINQSDCDINAREDPMLKIREQQQMQAQTRLFRDRDSSHNRSHRKDTYNKRLRKSRYSPGEGENEQELLGRHRQSSSRSSDRERRSISRSGPGDNRDRSPGCSRKYNNNSR